MTLYLTVDGTSWMVERRHETTQLESSRRAPQEGLFLFFVAPDGELRRSEIADNFPTDPPAALLAAAWRNAEVLRAGTPGEMQSRGGLVVPRLRDVVRLWSRALRLRCPNCGKGHALKSWFTLRDRCSVCGLRLERGEQEDYFLGGMMFNIILAEAVFLVVFLGVLLALWPNVPWDGLEYVLAGAMIAAPLVLYPISRLLWLALDLLIRPPDTTEMEWHASSPDRPGKS